MDDEREANQLLADLKALSKYCFERLARENILPEVLYSRKAYAYSLFIFGLSFTDGIATLAEKGQARSAIPVLRSLQESWINSMFIYVCRSNIWLYYLMLQDELKTKSKRDALFAAGKVEDVSRYQQRTKEANKIISFIKRRYKELPLVPGIITTKNRSLEARKLSLKEKCGIIDYYNSLKKPGLSKKHVTLVEHYEIVYYFFSGTSHLSPVELNNLYEYDEKGNLHVDISGGEDRKFLSSLLLNAYLYQYQLMKLFHASVSTSNEKLPEEIKNARRRVVATKQFRS